MKAFDHKKIEKKWAAFWEKSGIYSAKDFDKKPKFYGLIEFPYPSGDGLHVGHIRSYTAMDIISRKRRMEGYNVLYPIGWDAFGLPTENYAIKTGIHPKIVTKNNTDTFRRQLKSLGFSFDWDREINTTDPAYYKWTQWIFLQFFKHGLAYKKKMPINWCPSCKIGLANEEVINGKCERCGTLTEKREKEQWLLAITKYADRLLKDLDTVEYLDRIKIQQRNWIGRSEGSELEFRIQNIEYSIKVFTTRADTLFGATYMVLAPEHRLVKDLEYRIENLGEVKKYIGKAGKKTEVQRTEVAKDKTGVELKGVKAINPATKKEIPVWIADYVLSGYGTGAIMAVPAHDERDFEFATRYKLPVLEVVALRNDADSNSEASPMISGDYGVGAELRGKAKQAFIEDGTLVNSGKFDGMDSEKAKWEITKFVGGKKQTQYHLRDWIFSRQRYWGEPIPLVFCEECRKRVVRISADQNADQRRLIRENPRGNPRKSAFTKGEILNPGWVPVREEDLPVELPEVKKYKPIDTGESPLAALSKWVNVKCPKCGNKAKRETDTMPNWAGSSWYYLAYPTKNSKFQIPNSKLLKYWIPVNWYNGGMEHTTLHLLYSRFWNKFLFDIGAAPTSEPYAKRTSHGLILAESGGKMSKSKGNVVNPDFIVEKFGADAIRMYEMFMGPFDQAISWDHRGLGGVYRFLSKICDISEHKTTSLKVENTDLEKLLHKTIKKVSQDIETMDFNTAVSALMIFVNKCYESSVVSRDIWKNFLLILAPFAPFIAEELYQKLKVQSSRLRPRFAKASSGEQGFGGQAKLKAMDSVHLAEWPKYNKEYIKDEIFELIIQINGKVRDKVRAPTGISQKEAEKAAMEREKVGQFLGGHKPKKIIFVPNRLINIVV